MENEIKSIEDKIKELEERKKEIKIKTKESRWQEVLDAKEMFFELFQQYMIDYEGLTPNKEPIKMGELVRMGTDLYGQYETALGIVEAIKMIGGSK